MARRFSGKQRVALYLAGDSKCAICGTELVEGWHADHVHPHSKGGLTDVVNGQALCAKCNLTKGIRVQSLRPWQEKALRVLQGHEKTDFLLEATPGAGKTRFGVEAVHRMILDKRALRVFIVVPSNFLRQQWQTKAMEIGLQIQARWDNATTVYPRDVKINGIAITYSQVANAPHLFRIMSSDCNSVVIFDEIHHCCDETDSAWGVALRLAFDHPKCVSRICMTGTPFRTENNKIPFVAYDESGKCIADYKFNYLDGLRDGVCRGVSFPALDGSMEWTSADGKDVEAGFDEKLPEWRQRERYRTAIMTGGNLMKQAMYKSFERLLAIRKIDADAALLGVFKDQTDCKEKADMFYGVTGVRPVVVLSDDRNASDKIKSFAKEDHHVQAGKRDKVLFAVRMASEGIDCPRLSVGLFATNIMTELFFRQFVGRFVRVECECNQAVVFMPGDPKLLKYAKAIRKEVDAKLAEDKEKGKGGGGNGDTKFVPHGSAGDVTQVIFDGESLTSEEIELASAALEMHKGVRSTPEELAALLRDYPHHITPRAVPAMPDNEEIPQAEKIKKMGAALNKRIYRISKQLDEEVTDINICVNDEAVVHSRVYQSVSMDELLRCEAAVDKLYGYLRIT